MPFRPTSVDRSGQILAQSLSKTSNRLFDASAQRKKLETLLGTMNPDLKPELGNFNLSELEGMVDVMAQERVEKKLALEQRAADRADRTAQLQEEKFDFAQETAEKTGARADEYLGIQKNAQDRRATIENIERNAVRAAYSGPASAEDLAASIAAGAKFEDLPTRGSTPSVQRYIDAGGALPENIEQLAESAAGAEGGFQSELQTVGISPDGKPIQMVTTSAKSAIPAPGTPSARGKTVDPIDQQLEREIQLTELWEQESAGSRAMSMRMYYTQTRDENGRLKPGAVTNAADERQLKRIEAIMAKMNGGKPTNTPGSAKLPPMSAEQFIQGMSPSK